MALDTFKVEPGGNLFDTLKKKFPWKADWQIWNQIIPDVMEKNKGVLNDPNQVSPNVTYLVSEITKPFEKFPTREEVTYEPFDVAQYGEGEADAFRTFAAKTTSERNAILDQEYNQTRKLANLAAAFGVNVSLPQRRTTATTADPAKGIAEAKSMEKFKQILYDNPPQNKAEAFALAKATNASKSELEFLNKLFPKLDLGKQVAMYRYKDGKIETIWRHENAPLGDERAAGFTLKFDAAKLEKTGSSERNQARLSSLSLAANITTQEEYDTFIDGLSSEDQKLLKTDPKVLDAVHKFVPDAVLKSAGKLGLWTRDENGRAKIVYFDPSKEEYQTKLDSGDFFKTLDELESNEDFDLTNFIVDLMNSPTLAPDFADLTDPLKRAKILEKALQAGVTATSKEILEAYDKAVDIDARNKKKYVTDVNTLNNKINDFKSWNDFYAHIKGKQYDEQAVTETAQKLQDRYGDTWRFDPVMMFNDKGEQKWITSGQELQDAHDSGYWHEEYNQAPNRPVPEVSDRFWASEQPKQDWVTVLLPDNKTMEVYTDQGKSDRINETRDDITKSVTDFESFTQRINMIMTQLAQGKRGTDLQAIRDLEKLKDETGVIRESDVRLIRESIGTYLDWLQRLGNKLAGKENSYLTQQERDQVALAALTTLGVLRSSMSKVVKRHKLGYDWDTVTTWASKGRDKIDFFQVIPEPQYKIYTDPFDWKDQTHLWKFQPGFTRGTWFESSEETDDSELSSGALWLLGDVETTPEPEIEDTIPEGLTKESTLRALLRDYEEKGNTAMAAQVRRRLTELGY